VGLVSHSSVRRNRLPLKRGYQAARSVSPLRTETPRSARRRWARIPSLLVNERLPKHPASSTEDDCSTSPVRFVSGQGIQAAREAADIGGFEPGHSVLDRRSRIRKFSTGYDALDELLSGRIETQSVTELYGNEGSGRTDIVHSSRGKDSDSRGRWWTWRAVAYVDTRRRFDPERIFEIVESLLEADRTALTTQLTGPWTPRKRSQL